jgi:predicted enzyme related to lactoylglutathione lyase
VAKVISLGGTTVRPPRDIPYGRMAVMADDHGAVFSAIMAPGKNA